MDSSSLPPIKPTFATDAAQRRSETSHRRNRLALSMMVIALLVVLFYVPLAMINSLRAERAGNVNTALQRRAEQRLSVVAPLAVEGHRMVERAVKHGMLVVALVFTAFFLFDVVAHVRLHPVHYGLVGGALVLFYLALLSLGEVLAPGAAYLGAAGASSLLIVTYSAAILRRWGRAVVVAGFLAAVHSVLFVVLRMEDFALLAGTGALFVALATVMYLTRRIDWANGEIARAADGAAATP